MVRKHFDLSADRVRQTEALRRAILQAAVKMLARGGPDALNLRDVGAAVGATTKVVYSHFGSKSGLIAAIYADGFGRLAQAMEIAAQGARTPRKKLAAAANAYRDFARANTEVFHVMYGPLVRKLAPTVVDRAAATPSLTILVEGFELAGLAPATARDRARNLWTAIHGPIVLELTGWLFDGEAEARFDAAFLTALEGVL